MKHLGRISRTPKPAQVDGFCENADSDFEARLCFALAFLNVFTGLFDTLLDVKFPPAQA